MARRPRRTARRNGPTYIEANKEGQVGSVYVLDYNLGPYTELTVYFDTRRWRLSVSALSLTSGPQSEIVNKDVQGSPVNKPSLQLPFTFDGRSLRAKVFRDQVYLEEIG